MTTIIETLLGGGRGWMRDGLCQEYPNVDFFPGPDDEALAVKAICAQCLVVDECLRYALLNRIVDGVWGKTTEKERRRMLRSKPKPAPSEREPVRCNECPKRTVRLRQGLCSTCWGRRQNYAVASTR
jgi:WhiB family redox-sensing transcriptional regulator